MAPPRGSGNATWGADSGFYYCSSDTVCQSLNVYEYEDFHLW
jgi:hypothetical protein